MTQKKLVLDLAEQSPSSKIFSDDAILSSSQNGWKGIEFEYHYQNPTSLPEYRSTELVIAIGHSPMLIKRWLAGEFREENTQAGDTALPVVMRYSSSN